MSRWQGQVAVVTGASAGIGAAIAEKLVENGIKVVGLARRKERIEELADKLHGNPGKLFAVKADMTQEEEILKAFEWIKENVGPVSILINNAGVGRKTTIVNGDISAWKQLLDTNVLGLAIATREGIRSMQENNIEGHIININSIVGHVVLPLPYQNLYPASKHAVTAFSETLRHELLQMGSKIKITSISPGCVNTEIFAAGGLLDDEAVKEILDKTPSLQPEDVANAMLYALETPPHVQISELTIKPVGEIV